MKLPSQFAPFALVTLAIAATISAIASIGCFQPFLSQ